MILFMSVNNCSLLSGFDALCNKTIRNQASHELKLLICIGSEVSIKGRLFKECRESHVLPYSSYIYSQWLKG